MYRLHTEVQVVMLLTLPRPEDITIDPRYVTDLENTVNCL